MEVIADMSDDNIHDVDKCKSPYRKIGEGIALAALIIAATVLEIHGKESRGLWALVVIWIIFL